MPETNAVKFFTLEEANATLPLVSRIVEDIVAEGQRVEELLAELEKGHSADPTPDDGTLREDVARASSQLETYLAELTQIGCLFKGPQGTVDFYSMLDGQPVFLCWTLGEPEILYWHDLEAGYAGRQPLVSASVPVPEIGYGPES
ncbi:MAG: DUF2203 domain-containing protein [Gemmatimonadota bacterium]